MVGAIDNEFADAERSTEEILTDAVADLDTDLRAGSVALDLITHQPLFVHKQVAETLIEYYEREGFDLFSYKMHPYLPVRTSDRVFECVFVPPDP